MQDKRIQEVGHISICTVCIPKLLKSLEESNIGIRCTHLCKRTHTPIHLNQIGIRQFRLEHSYWKWENKIKLSNRDRKLLIQFLKDEISS